MTVIATYDITDNGRRSRVAALLQAHGDRLQKSVFLLELAPEAMSTVRDRAREILNLDEDSFYIFAQCGACWERVECHGQADKPERVLYWSAW